MLPNLIVFLYALLPVTLLTSYSLPSAVFYALIAASLALLVQKRFEGAREQTYRYRWLIASYSVLFIAVAASSIYHGKWAGANSEGALRFFLGLWVLLLAFPHIPQEKLRQAMWGMLVAVGLSASIMLWMRIYIHPRPATPGLILTTYTAIMLMLTSLAVYATRWKLSPWPRAENVFKVVLAGFAFASFLSVQTRTGLQALPVFVLIGLVLFFGIKKPFRLMSAFMVVMALGVVLISGNNALRGRIKEGINDVQVCQGEERTKYSSMCVRMQLWRAAVDAGVSNPWFGLGDGGSFHQYMQDVSVPKGDVAKYVITEKFGEPHNDVLLMFYAFGFPGALGLVLIYFVPCIYFLSRLLSPLTLPEAKVAAAMGLVVCVGFALCGLTDTLFRRMNTMGFYASLVAWLMVLSANLSANRSVKSRPKSLA